MPKLKRLWFILLYNCHTLSTVSVSVQFSTSFQVASLYFSVFQVSILREVHSPKAVHLIHWELHSALFPTPWTPQLVSRNCLWRHTHSVFIGTSLVRHLVKWMVLRNQLAFLSTKLWQHVPSNKMSIDVKVQLQTPEATQWCVRSTNRPYTRPLVIINSARDN